MHNIFISDPDPFVITSPELNQAKLELLDLKKGELVGDLGCGDASALIAACEYADVFGVGYENRPEVYDLAIKKIEAAGLSDRITIHQGDFMDADLSSVNALIIYLTRGMLGNLSLKMENELPAGARIATHSFDVPGWEITAQREVIQKDGSLETVYLHKK